MNNIEETQIVENYAHDYREMLISEKELTKVFNSFLEEIKNTNMNKFQELTKTIQKAVPEITTIRLEDVLVTLSVNKKSSEKFFVNSNGFFAKLEIDEDEYKCVARGEWQLNTPFHRQTEKTINVLWDLICKK